MKLWQNITLSGIYTISPTHCGIGQASGAVDLPIARDTSTQFPVLPATSIKGVARDFFERAGVKEVERLFGKSLSDTEKAEELEAGAIAFTEGRLIAFPIRSLNQPFLHVTCPLILERFQRDLRALGLDASSNSSWQVTQPKPGQAHVAGAGLAGTTLVLEDLVYPQAGVTHMTAVSDLSKMLSHLLPQTEQQTRERLQDGLVVIPDVDFADLIQRATPVRARIKLTKGKTTTKWMDPETGEEDNSGNLWYEEYLPSDTLFVAFIGERRQRAFFRETDNNAIDKRISAMTLFKSHQEHLRVIQIGGNETVGYGLCHWTLGPEDGGKTS
jgi:CRISPR-associated protein Cmr4